MCTTLVYFSFEAEIELTLFVIENLVFFFRKGKCYRSKRNMCWVRLGLRSAACICCASSGLERMRGLERRVAKGEEEEEDDILMSYRRSR